MTTKKNGGAPFMCHDYARGNTFHTDGREEFAARVAKYLAKRAGFGSVDCKQDSYTVDRDGKPCAWHYEATFLTEIRGERARRNAGSLYRIEGRQFFTVHAVGFGRGDGR
jgi:hypothetical protein